MNNMKIIKKYESNSEKDTKNIAKNILKEFFVNKNMINIILKGDLGVGKTKFVEGILENYLLQDEISSPTFTIVNEYVSDNIIINHFDVYRLTDLDEFIESGLEEKLYSDNLNKKTINLIEWGENILDILPKPIYIIEIDKVDKINQIDKRELKVYISE